MDFASACRDIRHVRFFPILRRYEKLVDSESSLHKVQRRHLRSASLPSSCFNRRAERVKAALDAYNLELWGCAHQKAADSISPSVVCAKRKHR